MEGLVRVGRTVFHHDVGGGALGPRSVTVLCSFAHQPFGPVVRGNFEVQKAFDHVEAGNGAGGFHHGRTQLLGRSVGSSLAVAGQGEAYHGSVAGEFAPCLLNAEFRGGQGHTECGIECRSGQCLHKVIQSGWGNKGHGQEGFCGRKTSASMHRTDPPPSRSMVGMGAWTMRAWDSSTARCSSVKAPWAALDMAMSGC